MNSCQSDSPPAARDGLRPYVTAWGSDPLWRSELPELPPTVAAFPRHVGWASGLTLAELPPDLAVVVAAHDVHFDPQRKLWYCDIEIDSGDSYYPFVRLAIARYQAHSVPNAHLSRVVTTDSVQLAPDRTAEVSLSEDRAAVAVSGVSGRNKVADLPGPPAVDAVEGFGDQGSQSASTTMRVALQRRLAGIPGDLGWEQVGPERTLAASDSVLPPLSGRSSQFHVARTGEIPLPGDAASPGRYRLLITEVETYLRGYPIPGDPSYATFPRDFVRERVVYADAFEL